MPRFFSSAIGKSKVTSFCRQGRLSYEYHHPASTYTVFLRNINQDRPDDLTFISMQLVFEAPTLVEAKAVGEQFAKEFLDYLAFTTNLKVRLRTLLQIYSWEQDWACAKG